MFTAIVPLTISVHDGRESTTVDVAHSVPGSRLAKLRDLMYRGKYSAVIGRKMHFFVCIRYPVLIFRLGFFYANHSAVFPPVLEESIKPRNFAKRRCERHCDSG